MKTSASQLFDDMNRKYWRGRLPRYRVIRRAALREGIHGSCSNVTRTILLAPHASDEALRLTLLHEMCHIGTGLGYDHGPRFLRKMRRLVRLGETELVEEDIENYDGSFWSRGIEALRAKGHVLSEIPFRVVLEDDIEALARAHRLQTIRWPLAAAHLAKQHHMSVSQLRRAAPWAERVWRERTAFERQERRLRQQFGDAAVGGS